MKEEAERSLRGKGGLCAALLVTVRTMAFTLGEAENRGRILSRKLRLGVCFKRIVLEFPGGSVG